MKLKNGAMTSTTPLDKDTVEAIEKLKQYTGLTFRSEIIRFAVFDTLNRYKKGLNEQE